MDSPHPVVRGVGGAGGIENQEGTLKISSVDTKEDDRGWAPIAQPEKSWAETGNNSDGKDGDAVIDFVAEDPL